MSKTYTNRSNCIRAAKVALGKTAKSGAEFNIVKDGTAYSWVSLVATPKHADAKPAKAKRNRSKNGVRASLLQQPAFTFLFGKLRRVNGATIGELVDARDGTSSRDTERGKISLAISAGAPITKTREGRFVRYNLPSEWTP